MDAEQQYIRGFNSGYILAQHEPELLSKVTSQLAPKTEYLQGLLDGKKELELETSRNQLNELKQLRKQSRNRENGLEKE